MRTGDTFVEAMVTYLPVTDRRAKVHLNDETLDRNPVERASVRIHDARPHRSALTLDINGFALFDLPTSLRDLSDAEIRRVYEPELACALREATGASDVIITKPAFLRVGRPSRAQADAGVLPPATYVHSDCTPRSGFAIAQALVGPDCPREWLQRRFAIYSLWRVFSPAPQAQPIAVCDAQSVSADDVVPSEVLVRDGGQLRTYEGMNFRYNPAHRWSYFRDMHRDELLLIKAFDTDRSRAWRVPHVGFTDPSAPADAPARVSIDVRGVAFFD